MDRCVRPERASTLRHNEPILVCPLPLLKKEYEGAANTPG